MALPAHFEDGVRERSPDIDGEGHPADIAWLHGPRLYRTASRSRARKDHDRPDLGRYQLGLLDAAYQALDD